MLSMTRYDGCMGGTYHHGNLRRALLDATAEAVADVGPTACSVRDIARRAGVSHAAPVHHFGDRAGLLTAFAAEGFTLLADALDGAARVSGGDLVEVGAAYVAFAVEHRPHFEVMFRRDLLRTDDPDLVAAMGAATGALRSGLDAEAARVGASSDAVASLDLEAVLVGAWAQMHGLATLLVGGNLPARLGDPRALARRVSVAMDRAAVLQHGAGPRPAP